MAGLYRTCRATTLKPPHQICQNTCWHVRTWMGDVALGYLYPGSVHDFYSIPYSLNSVCGTVCKIDYFDCCFLSPSFYYSWLTNTKTDTVKHLYAVLNFYCGSWGLGCPESRGAICALNVWNSLSLDIKQALHIFDSWFLHSMEHYPTKKILQIRVFIGVPVIVVRQSEHATIVLK